MSAHDGVKVATSRLEIVVPPWWFISIVDFWRFTGENLGTAELFRLFLHSLSTLDDARSTFDISENESERHVREMMILPLKTLQKCMKIPLKHDNFGILGELKTNCTSAVHGSLWTLRASSWHSRVHVDGWGCNSAVCLPKLFVFVR